MITVKLQQTTYLCYQNYQMNASDTIPRFDKTFLIDKTYTFPYKYKNMIQQHCMKMNYTRLKKKKPYHTSGKLKTPEISRPLVSWEFLMSLETLGTSKLSYKHKSLVCSSSTSTTLDPAPPLQQSNLVSKFTSKPLPRACTEFKAVCKATAFSPISSALEIEVKSVRSEANPVL